MSLLPKGSVRLSCKSQPRCSAQCGRPLVGTLLLVACLGSAGACSLFDGERGELKDGMRTGPWVYQYLGSPSPYATGEWWKGMRHGDWDVSRGDGAAVFTGSYDRGVRVGLWHEYHDDGSIASEGSYKDGVKDGEWQFFRPDGSVDHERSGMFRDGVREQ